MKENFTSITVILDKSGSMWHLASDTIGGFNQFLKEQKETPGEAILTLCTFDTDYHLIHECKALNDVPNLDDKTYVPNGGTALLDALGSTIDSVGKQLSSMKEEERPSKVVFLIITDGQENSSKHYTADKVREMVSHQQEKYNWSFVFMGANIDAFSEGTAIGISLNNTMNYSATQDGTRYLYNNVSHSLKNYRSSKSVDSNDFFAKNKK